MPSYVLLISLLLSVSGCPAQLLWPVRSNSSDPAYQSDIIQGTFHMDHQSGPGLMDFECGQNTYEGHRDSDFATWPFPWFSLEHDIAVVQAVSDGFISEKVDLLPDTLCEPGSGLGNYIKVEHSDGTSSTYAHLKQGSLSSKAIGSKIYSGDYLGIVGNSGNSTGPHLHFEYWDQQGNLLDPFAGDCSPDLWWIDMPDDFTDSKIQALYTHGFWPEFSFCPNTENSNFQRTFLLGDTIYLGIYLANVVGAEQVDVSLMRPDGSTAAIWTRTYSGSTSLNHRFIIDWNSEGENQTGLWTLEADLWSPEISQSESFQFEFCENEESCYCPKPETPEAVYDDLGILGGFSWSHHIRAKRYELGVISPVEKSITTAATRWGENQAWDDAFYRVRLRSRCTYENSDWSDLKLAFGIEAIYQENPSSDATLFNSLLLEIQKLEVFDTQGKLVISIADPSFPVRLDHLSSGLYILAWHAGDFVYKQKWILP